MAITEGQASYLRSKSCCACVAARLVRSGGGVVSASRVLTEGGLTLVIMGEANLARLDDD